jgi:hypothetical protein
LFDLFFFCRSNLKHHDALSMMNSGSKTTGQKRRVVHKKKLRFPAGDTAPPIGAAFGGSADVIHRTIHAALIAQSVQSAAHVQSQPSQPQTTLIAQPALSTSFPQPTTLLMSSDETFAPTTPTAPTMQTYDHKTSSSLLLSTTEFEHSTESTPSNEDDEKVENPLDEPSQRDPKGVAPRMGAAPLRGAGDTAPVKGADENPNEWLKSTDKVTESGYQLFWPFISMEIKYSDPMFSIEAQ